MSFITECYNQFQLRTTYYTSSYLGPLGGYPVLISTSSTNFIKKQRNSSVSLSGFFSLLISFTIFSLPHAGLKLQRWNPWVSVCPVILKIFLFGWKVKANNSFAHNFSGSYFSFCFSFSIMQYWPMTNSCQVSFFDFTLLFYKY